MDELDEFDELENEVENVTANTTTLNNEDTTIDPV